jgi:copper chaperone CopZ
MSASGMRFLKRYLKRNKEGDMKTEKIGIEGMHCGHCSALVKNSISLVKGVKDVDVSAGEATVVFDEGVTERTKLEEAVTRFGYKIKD